MLFGVYTGIYFFVFLISNLYLSLLRLFDFESGPPLDFGSQRGDSLEGFNSYRTRTHVWKDLNSWGNDPI